MGKVRTRRRRSSIARAHREHSEQLTLDLFPDESTTPTYADRPYSSWSDRNLQDFLLLDLDKGYADPDLTKELDARVSAAFLDFFENLGPDPDGTTLVLHPGLKQKLESSADHLKS